MKKKLLVIIPCYNEEATIAHLLKELSLTNFPENIEYEIVVINDCSSDNTSAIVTQFPVLLINLPINLGIGGAMQTGFKYAIKNRFDLAVQMDGDGQHPPSELLKMLNHQMKSNANLIIGSRFITKQGFQSSVLRRSGIRYLQILNKILTGKNVYDTTSGFRLLDNKALELFAHDYPDEYPEPDSLIRCSLKGILIEEVAVIMRERQGGVSSIQYFSQLYYIIKVSLAMFYSFIRN
jgi:glycosyltransferase involved in cell wall biosynthesis